ncbi:hypothetical protein B0H19DRAFT_1140695 [Mycena capillaripes]|nr:hypothetical protein B0H19DRAFT_1140695 [Mycena capillaripes]
MEGGKTSTNSTAGNRGTVRGRTETGSWRGVERWRGRARAGTSKRRAAGCGRECAWRGR